MINPVTNRKIKRGGATHVRLTKLDKLPNPWIYFIKPNYGIRHKLLQINKLGKYSITKPRPANQIANIILTYIKKITQKKMHIITDGCANVGGNTISFLLKKFSVNAVEIDKPTCTILKNNISLYKFDIKYEVFCADYTTIYETLKQDIVFLDPPWGGVDYKKKKLLDLYLQTKSGKININMICYNLLAKKLTRLIVLKLPHNFNESGLSAQMNKLPFVVNQDIHQIYNKLNKKTFNLYMIYPHGIEHQT